MENETYYRIAFGVIFAVVIVVRGHYHRVAGTYLEPVVGNMEPPIEARRRVIWGLLMLATCVIYLSAPQWLVWSAVELPEAVRWAGAGISGLGLLLLLWVQWALGKNFSTTLRLRADHTLVTHGPYRWARHPMYTALILLWSGLVLLAANWFLGALVLLGILGIIRVRTPREEAMMLRAYGDAYREYMKRTGRFLPRLGGRGASAGPSGEPAQAQLPEPGQPVSDGRNQATH